MLRFIFIPTLCFSLITINAQQKNSFINYQFLTVNGLTNNAVHSIFQDSRGFMWIGTDDGLNMYDGQTVKQFYLSDFIPAQLNNNTIENICEDADGNLLMSAKAGIIKLNWFTKQFSVVYKNDFTSFGNQYPELFVDTKKNIWVCERVRIKKFDAHFHFAQEWVLHDSADKKIFAGPNVTRILNEDNRHNLWLTDRGTLIKINPVTSKADSTDNIYLHKLFKENIEINTMQFAGNNIFLLISNKIILKFDASFKQAPKFLMEDTVKGFTNLIISNNQLFITTGNAEILLADTNGIITSSDKKQTNISLSGNITTTKDKDGNLWIGTEKGLDELTIQTPLFYTIPLKNPTLFSNYGLTGITAVNNILYVYSTLGLINYDINKNSTEYFLNKINNRFSETRYSSFYPYKKYWLASTPNSTGFANENDHRLQYLKYNFNHPSKLDSTGSFTFYKDSKNNIWMGLFNDAGIVCWHTNNNQFECYSQKNTGKYFCPLRHFKYATEDKHGNIWMGYEKGGLAIFDVHRQKFISLPFNKNNPITDVSVSGMLNDNKGSLWIATNTGLICYNQNNNSYKIFLRKNGLPSNLIESVQKDEDGNVWAGFQGAICKINTTTKEIISFTTADGLPDDDFENAYYDSITKRMFFTGAEKIIYFFPQSLKKINPVLHPVITGMQVTDKDYPVYKGEKIELSYSQNYLSFNFSAPNYINAAENEYVCMLKGADKQWNFLGNQHTVNYTQLQPGNYVFFVKARVAGDAWSKASTSVEINISKPFWLTGWFWIVCGLIILSVIFSFAYLKLQAKYEKQMLSQNIRDKIAGDLHDDIGSTLSSVTILSELAKQKYAEATPLLERISQNISLIQENMSDIVWAINPRNDRFTNILQRMSQFAVELLESKNIILNFTADDSLLSLSLPMEKRRSLYLFYKEAINNCAKYSHATKVDVHLSKNENIVCLIITDDGKGFNISKNYRGNGMATMQKRAAELNGNVKINSVPEEGTFIELDFKV